jgi:hypothetical protein
VTTSTETGQISIHVVAVVGTGTLLLGNGCLDDDGFEDDGHNNRIQEEAAHTCAVGKHIHDGADRVEEVDACHVQEHAYAFRDLGACGRHMDPQHVVASCLLLPLRPPPSPRGSCRCAYLPHARNIAFLPWSIAMGNEK